MTFEGITSCPNCAANLAGDLRDVLRKAADDDKKEFDCPNCEAPITVTVRIRHRIEILRAGS